MTTKKNKYNMSFSTGGLFLQDSVKVAGLYRKTPNWSKIRKAVIEQNILQTRTQASAERISREICLRLALLSDDEIRIVIEGSPQDQAYMLWLAICRRHRFICEFAVEILREKFLTLQHKVTYEDFDAFFNAKASWADELESITDSTRKKLRQVLFKILREAGLLSPENLIIPAMLSSNLLKAIENTSRKDFRVFPISESDLKEWAK